MLIPKDRLKENFCFLPRIVSRFPFIFQVVRVKTKVKERLEDIVVFIYVSVVAIIFCRTCTLHPYCVGLVLDILIMYTLYFAIGKFCVPMWMPFGQCVYLVLVKCFNIM